MHKPTPIRRSRMIHVLNIAAAVSAAPRQQTPPDLPIKPLLATVAKKVSPTVNRGKATGLMPVDPKVYGYNKYKPLPWPRKRKR